MRSIILLALLLPLFSLAQSIAEKADQLMTAYTGQQRFSGNVLIAKEGKIIFRKAYGMADRQKGIPNTLETEFRAGSLTKMFTSTAILQLANEGKLSLTDPVEKFVPGFPNGDKIQVIHLLSHTSGIKGATGTPVPTNLTESVERFKCEGTAFEPGEQFEYNNFNYILLSYIAEKVSGKSLPQLLKDSVFDRAGMMHSGLDVNDRVSAHKSVGYVTDPKTVAWIPQMSGNVALASGAGALYSTVGDLYKWSQAVSAATVLKAATHEKAFTPVKGSYGLGWMLNDHNGHKGVGHAGSIEGYIAYFMKYPKEDVTIIFLSNFRDANGQQLANDLTAVAFGEPYSLPQVKKEIALGAEVLKQYTGEYELQEGFRITVSVEGGKLYALAPGDQEKTELAPESETKFFLKGPEIEVDFLKENGKVRYMFIHMQGGKKLVKVG